MLRRERRFPELRALVAALLAIAVVSGCGSDADRDTSEEEATVASMSKYMSEYGVLMRDCLAGKGFTVEVLPDGGISATVPPEQDQAYESARLECEKSTGYDTPPPAYDDKTLSYVYDKRVEAYECMIEKGFSPSEEPPSREAFIDSDGLWFPELGVAPERMEEAKTACPAP